MIIEAGEKDLVPIALELRTDGEPRPLADEGGTYETLCFRTVVMTRTDTDRARGTLVELETEREAAENGDSIAALVLDLSQYDAAPGTYPFEVLLRTYSDDGELLYHRTVEYCDRNVLVIRREVKE